MGKLVEQWFMQADYDLDTGEFMFKGRRFFYAVFMAHLAVEKGLKGLWQARLRTVVPKTHNLLYLVERIGLNLPKELDRFVATLNDVSVPTRYPDDLHKLMTDYTEARTKEIIEKSRETLTWIKTQR
jgi:HEPN domain-containing protein